MFEAGPWSYVVKLSFFLTHLPFLHMISLSLSLFSLLFYFYYYLLLFCETFLL